jgi:hypothetical protein
LIRLIIFVTFCQYSCGNEIAQHYSYVNKAHEHLVKKEYKLALKNLEKADKIKKSNIFQIDLSKYLSACYSDVDDRKKIEYFNMLLQSVDCENYLNSLKLKGNLSLNTDQDIQIRKKNSHTIYLDSLLEKDQFNRDLITVKEKKYRDSLHLLQFLEYSKVHGFPNEKVTRINCFSSGTGTDLYRLEILLSHFSGFKNVILDSMVQEEFKNLNICPETCANTISKIKDSARFPNSFLYINGILHITNLTLDNRKNINEIRKKYGLPSIELEYLLIKNKSMLLDLGFRINVTAYQIEVPTIPDGFTPENKFVELL